MNSQSLVLSVENYINYFELENKNINLDLYKEDLIDIFSYFETNTSNTFINFDINPGWVPMVVDLHNKLKYISDTYQIFQIKTKFGGLRYYAEYKEPSYSVICKHSTYDHKISASIFRDLIDLAESKSYRICEFTGENGSLRKINGYYFTLSDEEFSKRIS
jgi:hypothetical protein